MFIDHAKRYLSFSFRCPMSTAMVSTLRRQNIVDNIQRLTVSHCSYLKNGTNPIYTLPSKLRHLTKWIYQINVHCSKMGHDINMKFSINTPKCPGYTSTKFQPNHLPSSIITIKSPCAHTSCHKTFRSIQE